MKTKTIYRLLWVISILGLLALSCELVTQVGEVKSTAESLATSAASGKELLETGQALATRIDESGIKETALAVATKIEESGVQETVMAVGTKIDESGAKETVQAVVTDIGESGVKETLQAATTQLPSLSGEKPVDIPVLPGEIEDLLASQYLVSYFSETSYQEVVDFYEREMITNGWIKMIADSSVTENLATLVFEKENRKASVIITHIPFINQTTIVITIDSQ